MPASDLTPDPSPAPVGLHTLNTVGVQAICDATGTVWGHELFNRASFGGGLQHTAASDALVVFGVLCHAGPDTLLDNSTPVFINCTYASLSGGHLELLPPERTVLEIPPPPIDSAEELGTYLPAVHELRQRGFRVALTHHVIQDARFAAALPLADFIKFDLAALHDLRALQGLLARAQALSPAVRVAEKVETTAQRDALQALGVQLFQGYGIAPPRTVHTRVLLPCARTLRLLLQRLQQHAPTEALEGLLRQDPALAFHLLRVLRTSGLAADGRLDSLGDGLARMGLKRLFRWAALLLIASHSGGAASPWSPPAQVRAHMAAQLVRHLDENGSLADLAPLCGLLSLLDRALGLPMEGVLDLIALPDAVRQTLLHRQGPAGQLLQLSEACEQADDARFDASARALGLGAAQINLAHLQALAAVGAPPPA